MGLNGDDHLAESILAKCLPLIKLKKTLESIAQRREIKSIILMIIIFNIDNRLLINSYLIMDIL